MKLKLLFTSCNFISLIGNTKDEDAIALFFAIAKYFHKWGMHEYY
ncbi:hypothetical protein [Brunnivagina elsteri]|nr:hypothetical protein [Calothrix elsteri]